MCIRDRVVSKPGEKIAVDGKIINGKAHLDESFITGESKPASKTEGSKVIAGSINYDGYIEYEAEKIGKESTISEIVRLVIEATNTKAPIAKVADTVSGYFVPAVILIAIITFIAYLILGNTVSIAINVFVTILVVACPCSLGLATPLAIVVSEGVGHSDEIARTLQDKTGIEARTTILGHVQRGGAPTVRDRVVASQMAYYAVELLSQGIGNRVVGMQNSKIVDFDIQEALSMKKPFEEELYHIAGEIAF